MADANSEKLVLVTGGTGFVGLHCVRQLLQADYRVKTTLRSLRRKDEVIAALQNDGASGIENLSFVEADLTQDVHWGEAVKNCDYVLHVASPISLATSKDKNDFIVPAVQGTLRVLKAARDAGVKRVVMTSSFGAIGYGHKSNNSPFTEEMWTDPNYKGISPYIKSKTLAEKAAWDFIKNEGGALELCVMNPTGIFGPLLGASITSSLQIIQRLMTGEIKAAPQMNFGIIDVRDVAELHIRAMELPAANGQRFILQAGETLSLHEVAMILRESLGDKAENVPTKVLPNWVVRVASLFNATAKGILPQLQPKKNISNEKAKKFFNWTPRTNEEAVVASAESLLRAGLIKTDR